MASDPDRTPEPGEVPREAPDAQADWSAGKQNANRLCYALVVLGVVLLLIDPMIDKYGYFAIESFWGFYGILGAAGCAVLALAGHALSAILKRPEDYYDR